MATSKRKPSHSKKKKRIDMRQCWRKLITVRASTSGAWLKDFWRRHWKGTLMLAAATVLFFLPMIIRLNSYSPGGDAMFNAWTLARDQHCILRENCPNYIDSNIFYPHHDTMLYSEVQLSTALVTLPLHWISANPVFAYNIATIVSFFLIGWSMYLLVKYLSKGNEWVAVFAGLAFEFAPFRMAAIWHLQNLSIFCLPLAVLFILKFLEAQRRRYLVLLALVLLYVAWASWVQMVFVFGAVFLLLLGLGIFKAARWKPLLVVGAVVLAAAFTTLPLAVQYVRFAKSNHAAFSMLDQELYNSSVIDYFKPYDVTLLGKVYYALEPGAQRNAYNLDSNSYHGLVLYTVGIAVLCLAFHWRKRSQVDHRRFGLVAAFVVIAAVGIIISLGPFLKLKGSYIYPGLAHGLDVVIPLPYALVDKFLPQLAFIRAVGRGSVLFLFTLCALLAFVPVYVRMLQLRPRYQRIVLSAIGALIAIELLPLQMVPMSNLKQSYHESIPAVYQYIVAHPEIDNIVVLHGSDNYDGAQIPFAWTEDVLWAGYHNRNIFNGYSGYTPPDYLQEYIDFINFTPAVIPEMHSLHLRYVLIDKVLSGPTSHKPHLLHDVGQVLPLMYQDDHYALFKIS